MNCFERTARRRGELAPVDLGFVEDPGCPVIGYALDVEDARCAASHAHPRAQVIFASSGVMRVHVPGNTWFVPPSQAVYVPPLTPHEVQFPGKVAIRNLFIEPAAAGALPGACHVFGVTPLLRELIVRFLAASPVRQPDSPEGRIAVVILDELARAAPAPLNLPTSTDPRLGRVTEALLASPGDNRTLDAWADIAHTSSRTLARLFLRETGMTFADWRTQLRMLEGLDRLSRGIAVTTVALDLGYGEASAFIAAFRRKFGTSPGRYRT